MPLTLTNPPQTLRIALSASYNTTELILDEDTRALWVNFPGAGGRVYISGSDGAETVVEGSPHASGSDSWTQIRRDTHVPVRTHFNVKDRWAEGDAGVRTQIRRPRRRKAPRNRLNDKTRVFISSDQPQPGFFAEIRSSDVSVPLVGDDWTHYGLRGAKRVDPNAQFVSQVAGPGGSSTLVLTRSVATTTPASGTAFFWELKDLDDQSLVEDFFGSLVGAYRKAIRSTPAGKSQQGAELGIMIGFSNQRDFSDQWALVGEIFDGTGSYGYANNVNFDYTQTSSGTLDGVQAIATFRNAIDLSSGSTLYEINGTTILDRGATDTIDSVGLSGDNVWTNIYGVMSFFHLATGSVAAQTSSFEFIPSFNYSDGVRSTLPVTTSIRGF